MVGGEHMHIANLFLSNFIKVVVNFIWNFHGYVRIQNVWILDNWEFTVLS
jgi:hypothetical protein